MADFDQEQVYKSLAKTYSRLLPRGSPLDWEDLYQEMRIREIEYHSIQSVRWKVQHIVRDEWVRRQPRELSWIQKRSPRLDTICEAYRMIQRWPWLLSLLLEGSQASLARAAGVQKAAVGKRLNHVRADLGLARRYRILAAERV